MAANLLHLGQKAMGRLGGWWVGLVFYVLLFFIGNLSLTGFGASSG